MMFSRLYSRRGKCSMVHTLAHRKGRYFLSFDIHLRCVFHSYCDDEMLTCMWTGREYVCILVSTQQMFCLESISVSSVYECSVQLIGTRRDLSKAWARQLSREKQVCSSMRVSIEKIPPLPPNKMSSYRVSQVSEGWGRASMPSVNSNLAKKPSSVCPVPSLCPVYDLRSHHSSDITPPISSIGSVRWEGHRGHTALLFIELVRERSFCADFGPICLLIIDLPRIKIHWKRDHGFLSHPGPQHTAQLRDKYTVNIG